MVVTPEYALVRHLLTASIGDTIADITGQSSGAVR